MKPFSVRKGEVTVLARLIFVRQHVAVAFFPGGVADFGDDGFQVFTCWVKNVEQIQWAKVVTEVSQLS